MGRRIYSDTFIDRQIAKIDEMFERNQRNILLTPECLIEPYRADFQYHARICPSDVDKIKAYYKQFQELAYVRGFWMGWTLREGCKDL